ncbi:hypothetical protein C8J56DRAFT_756322, partial [Mycena floridula]
DTILVSEECLVESISSAAYLDEPHISAFVGQTNQSSSSLYSDVKTYFDSGVNHFCFVEASAFKTYTPMNGSGSVANKGEQFHIAGRGCVELRVKSHSKPGQSSLIVLPNAIHCPD